jgi:dihydrofolate reductase
MPFVVDAGAHLATLTSAFVSKVVVSEFVTLDRVMEDPGGAEGTPGGGWAFKFERGPEGDKFKLDELMSADCMLLGRTTYEGFANAWPSMKDEVGFADRMNGMVKHVVSRSIEDPSWNNTRVISGEVAGAVAQLKSEPGGDILVAGSATLVHALTAADLVDEYRLMVYPLLLGAGKRLFAEGSPPAAFELLACQAVGGGVLALSYARAAAAPDGAGTSA